MDKINILLFDFCIFNFGGQCVALWVGMLCIFRNSLVYKRPFIAKSRGAVKEGTVRAIPRVPSGRGPQKQVT